MLQKYNDNRLHPPPEAFLYLDERNYLQDHLVYYCDSKNTITIKKNRDYDNTLREKRRWADCRH